MPAIINNSTAKLCAHVFVHLGAFSVACTEKSTPGSWSVRDCCSPGCHMQGLSCRKGSDTCCFPPLPSPGVVRCLSCANRPGEERYHTVVLLCVFLLACKVPHFASICPPCMFSLLHFPVHGSLVHLSIGLIDFYLQIFQKLFR